MAITKRRYLSFLLRLWQVQDAGKAVWRASLEDPYTGERLGFNSPEAMVAYVWEKIRIIDREGEPEQDPGSIE
jgi:hypothetical protein